MIWLLGYLLIGLVLSVIVRIKTGKAPVITWVSIILFWPIIIIPIVADYEI